MAPDARFPSSCSLDVVGIGNAIVDVLVQTDDSFLNAHGLQKGGMALIDEQQAEALYKASGPGLETSGGSVANTMVGIAQLGGRAGFIGRVRDDQLGTIFSHDIRAVGARFDTPSATSGATTARCLIYVTPDAERTMCTFLGASTQLEPDDLDLSMVRETKVLYLEGYLWDSPAAKRAFIAAAEACREAGGQVALSLSDGFCVDRHRDSFLELVNGHVDVLFANETEILSLYETADLAVALDRVRSCCSTVAITRGADGSVVMSGDERWDIGIFGMGDLLDTTGAGDLYAGGFLHAYTQGESLERCGQLGALCAGQIVTQLGARSQVSLKQLAAAHLN
ncbi:MAG: adenosine kinase [Synechococcus sp. BS301-5m-G54]|jgi:sugar/nucleoside kinase (ribokinase family)|uniref:adenosine kinase n=1 Tax=Synechococcus sp. KORDI-49 TaxID=585423 RepID=UPI0004E033FC|nr:adenosine kinase [Synechococcus sp. KORDI-49]AII47222.1 carbohydrate kinase [Synechococcus sp. KORDI-49]MBL6738632.1 adenosine kinase [Synechococcus sp. BS301-5m-G54]MBL6794946.1 adenosine kinase [Synechococcus sp. BS307-5m-G34]